MPCKISKDIYSQLGYCHSTIYSTRVQTHSTHSFTTYLTKKSCLLTKDFIWSAILNPLRMCGVFKWNWFTHDTGWASLSQDLCSHMDSSMLVFQGLHLKKVWRCWLWIKMANLIPKLWMLCSKRFSTIFDIFSDQVCDLHLLAWLSEKVI